MRRGMQMTTAGRTLVHHARLVLQQMDRLHGELGDYGTGHKGHVRLLFNTLTLNEHLPQVLSSFLASHPCIFVDLQERPSDEIVNAVRSDVCDIGMVSDWVDLQGLQTLPFCADALVRVVPRDHALAQRPACGTSQIRRAGWASGHCRAMRQDQVHRLDRCMGGEKPRPVRAPVGRAARPRTAPGAARVERRAAPSP